MDQPVRLNGIKIVHGAGDPSASVWYARVLNENLTDLGIDHVYVEHPGEHIFIDEESLPFLSDHLHPLHEIGRLRESVVSATTTLGATRVGQPTPLEVTVVLDVSPEAAESLRRIIVDLSSLGIPDDLPLEHVGDGRYMVGTTVTQLRTGRHDLPILMETTEGKRYHFLTDTLDVYPGGDEYLYQDRVGSLWEARVSLSSAMLDLTAATPVHQGN